MDFSQPPPPPRPHTLITVQSFAMLFIFLTLFICLFACFFAYCAHRLGYASHHHQDEGIGLSDLEAGQRGGLQREAIRTSNQQQLTPIIYKKYKATLKFNDCVICLEDFKEGETCGVLPLCDHSFHPKCICLWLVKSQEDQNNQTCPICRCTVAC
ncbi:hypothetical protein HYC85_001417 [Camellia sinensis]|uniref:RING-type domain-containing protein n=1 Tax=Camellia sinensis TaxID=4442 RepID=A0A7J7I7V1_CAMSI|nr:hypothetical protein HYC85_001417 [Camellia sinensis]